MAVLRGDDGVCGFLPFHIKTGGCAAPVGGQICDYQGIIGTAPDAGRRGERLLRGCGLSAYDFNHGLAGDPLMSANAFAFSVSRRADLRDGLESWTRDVSANSKQLATVRRKMRKIEREIGPLRLERHDASDSAWSLFRRWKDDSLRQQGAPGFLEPEWVNALIHDLRDQDEPRFGGMFSTLYAGDRMIAAHFGLRSHRAWHWWFPSYDPALGNMSPGMVLLLLCIEEAANMGLEEIDFGRGEQRYKQQFGNRSRELCEGSLERPATPCGAIRACRKSMQRLANRTLPGHAGDIFRRGCTKVLRAGLL